MPYYKTTITPPEAIQSYLRTLQGVGHLALDSEGTIEYTYEAPDYWEAAIVVKETTDEADANFGSHHGSTQYEKAVEVPAPRLSILDMSEVRSLTPAQVTDVSNYLRENGVRVVAPHM